MTIDLKLKKNLDTSNFVYIGYVKKFDKYDLCKIFGEDKIKTTEYNGQVYYEWRIMFGEYFYSIYASDLDCDIMWILAGNKKDKKNVKLLYDEMEKLL